MKASAEIRAWLARIESVRVDLKAISAVGTLGRINGDWEVDQAEELLAKAFDYGLEALIEARMAEDEPRQPTDTTAA